jgi:hypothetical protein
LLVTQPGLRRNAYVASGSLQAPVATRASLVAQMREDPVLGPFLVLGEPRTSILLSLNAALAADALAPLAKANGWSREQAGALIDALVLISSMLCSVTCVCGLKEPRRAGRRPYASRGRIHSAGRDSCRRHQYNLRHDPLYCRTSCRAACRCRCHASRKRGELSQRAPH